jgi:hypothetical protein
VGTAVAVGGDLGRGQAMSPVDAVTGAFSRDELAAFANCVLVSTEPPRGGERLDEWIPDHASELGRRYTSELARNVRGGP